MDLNLSDGRNILEIVQTVALAAVAVVAWLRKPGEDAAAAVSELREEIKNNESEVNERLATLEERVEHMPTKEELSEVEGSVKEVKAIATGLAEAVSTIRTALGRIENYLLNSK